MRIALHEPDIAGNVGTLLRTAACLGVGVDLIEPMGFPWGDRSLARAGLDYAAQTDVVRHVDWAAFERQVAGRIVLLTTAGATALPDATFHADDVLLLGAESRGVPETVHARADLRVRVPLGRGFRSLNVAIAGAIVLGEALRQTRWHPDPSRDPAAPAKAPHASA